MVNLQAKIENNVANKRSKTYASYENAMKKVEKKNEELNVTLNAMIVALSNGRFTVAVYCGHDERFNMTSYIHSCPGWFFYN